MLDDSLTRAAAWLSLGAPALTSGLLALLLATRARAEGLLSRVFAAPLVTAWAASLALVARYVAGGELAFQLGTWSAGVFVIALPLSLNWVSASVVLFVTTLTGLIGCIAFGHLHRERRFVRFFSVLGLLQAGVTLLALTGMRSCLVR